MQQDAHGLPVSTDAPEAAQAWDHVVAGYLKYRADTPARLQAALAADPEFGLGHALHGSLAMLSYRTDALPTARAALARAERFTAEATERERAHVAALSAWVEGELDRALATWEGILADHPRDVMAFRLHHFNAFWLGRPEAMLKSVETVLPQWHSDLPNWANMLACRAFANEECGLYTVAEAAGRDAIALDPGDLWAAHAVAHVFEMQGRRAEGIVWINGLEPHWAGGNNQVHHLWWHRALFHLERQEWPEVLRLYDRGFRCHDSDLTAAQPDLYIDVQNAASMLLRLELRGVHVGDRWKELADKAEARIGDHLSAFTLPHWMMALVAGGRFEAAGRMLEALRDHARANRGTTAAIIGSAALPACEAVLRHRRGDFAGAVAALRPALGGLYRLGGSHAQQDILEQLYLDAALKAGLEADARLLLERVAGRHPVPPHRRVGYAEGAREVAF